MEQIRARKGKILESIYFNDYTDIRSVWILMFSSESFRVHIDNEWKINFAFYIKNL